MGDVVSLGASWANPEPPKDKASTNAELFDSHIYQCRIDAALALQETLTEFAAFCRVLEVDDPKDLKVGYGITSGRFGPLFASAMFFQTTVSARNGIIDTPPVEEFFRAAPSPEEVLAFSMEEAGLFLEERKLALKSYRDAFEDLERNDDLTILDIRRLAVNDTSPALTAVTKALMTRDEMSHERIFNISRTMRYFDPSQYDVADTIARISDGIIDKRLQADPEMDDSAYNRAVFLKNMSKMMALLEKRGHLPTDGLSDEGSEVVCNFDN